MLGEYHDAGVEGFQKQLCKTGVAGSFSARWERLEHI